MAIDPKARRKEREEKGWSPDPGEDFERAKWYDFEAFQSGGEKQIAAITGWEHWESPRKGTPGLDIRFTLTEGAFAGYQAKTTIWKTSDFSLGRLADIALCLGWEDPFDEEDDEDLERVFSSGTGLLSLTFKEQEPWENKDGEEVIPVEPVFFNGTRKPLSDERKSVIDAGVKVFNGYLKWREENPREAAAEEPKKGRSGGGGGNASRRSRNSGADEDIPF